MASLSRGSLVTYWPPSPEALEGVFPSSEAAAYWLAGFFDGEGTVNPIRVARRLSMSNTNRALVDSSIAALTGLGIECREKWYRPARPHYKPQWMVVVTGHWNFVLFQERVPIRCPEKRQKLAEILASYSYIPQPRLTSAVMNREAVTDLYWGQGLTADDIAALWSCERRTVLRFMRREDIPRRSKHEAGLVGYERRAKALAD